MTEDQIREIARDVVISSEWIEVPEGDFSFENGLVVTYQRVGATGYAWVPWNQSPEESNDGLL